MACFWLTAGWLLLPMLADPWPAEAPPDQPGPPAFVLLDDESGRLTLMEAHGDEQRPVLTYVYGQVLAEGVPEDRRRGAYVHPLYSLDGQVLTEDFPADHRHHRGLYWGWPGMSLGGSAPAADAVPGTDPDGERVDLWHLQGIGVRFEHWLPRRVGPNAVVFGAHNGWYTPDGRRVLDEVVWYRVHRADEVGRAIDVHVTWTAGDEPVHLFPRDAKGYGGLNLRFGPRRDTVISTAAGALPAGRDADRFVTPWADLSATFADERVAGIAVFDHPANPLAEAAGSGWILRHYGLLGTTWPGLGRFTFGPGRPVTVRHRLWIHRGNAETGRVAEAWAAWRTQAD